MPVLNIIPISIAPYLNFVLFLSTSVPRVVKSSMLKKIIINPNSLGERFLSYGSQQIYQNWLTVVVVSGLEHATLGRNELLVQPALTENLFGQSNLGCGK